MLSRNILYVLVTASLVYPQNLQLHYEASAERHYLVSTLEMFRPDAYGSTFWFIDKEYNAPGNHSMSLAYWEIARYFTLPVKNLSATIQYNDGVANFGTLGNVWLVGVNYVFDLGPVTLPLDILYRATDGADSPDFQLTTTWFVPLMDGRMELSGFLDCWSQDDAAGDGKQLVLLSEPQFWYNFGEHVSAGSEIELSHNFLFGTSSFKALPTLAMRWTF